MENVFFTTSSPKKEKTIKIKEQKEIKQKEPEEKIKKNYNIKKIFKKIFKILSINILTVLIFLTTISFHILAIGITIPLLIAFLISITTYEILEDSK